MGGEAGRQDKIQAQVSKPTRESTAQVIGHGKVSTAFGLRLPAEVVGGGADEFLRQVGDSEF